MPGERRANKKCRSLSTIKEITNLDWQNTVENKANADVLGFIAYYYRPLNLDGGGSMKAMHNFAFVRQILQAIYHAGFVLSMGGLAQSKIAS